MRRRHFLSVVAAVVAGPWGLAACRRAAGSASREKPQAAVRIVSLAPAVTDTLFAINGGEGLVGVSDYCEPPASAAALPRLGTSITPNFEAILRLTPTLIVSEANASSRRRELEAIATTRLLPWLTLAEIAESTREIGRLTRSEAAADALAQKLLERLGVPEPASGPRVLLVLGEPGPDEIWFVRKNSLHGAALHAAGGRNAVDRDVVGPPRLSLEGLFAVDPDAILVLTRPRERSAGEQKRMLLARFEALRAVRAGRLGLVESDAAFSNGPRILSLVDALRSALKDVVSRP
ncbi:MAG: ABC transporter substrate-binding protein [Pseudomonadota bacterium]